MIGSEILNNVTGVTLIEKMKNFSDQLLETYKDSTEIYVSPDAAAILQATGHITLHCNNDDPMLIGQTKNGIKVYVQEEKC